MLKMNSKMLNLIMGCALSLSLMVQVMPTYAQANDISTSTTMENIEPHAAMCPFCQKGQVFTSTRYSAWTTTSTTNCTHCIYGKDENQQRYVYKTTTCNSCKRTNTTTKKEYRTVCKGTNTP